MPNLGSILCLLLLGAASGAGAADLGVERGESVFAIVTHKAGFASGRAHNHFVAAASYTVRAEGEEGGVAGAVFELELAAEDLAFDSLELQRRWYPRLAALGILDEPFGEPSDKDRAKIRQTALGPKQLDAKSFPTIRARLVDLAEEPATLGEVELAYRATLELEVHGRTARRPLAASVRWEGDTLHVEAAGTFRFSDFGVEPFSAFLGAVKNQDDFHVYVCFEASRGD